MLADRLRLTAGGLPQGAALLSHMENIPAIDVIGGKNLVIDAGTPSYTSFKFGTAIRFESFQTMAVKQAVILQSTLSSDWTIEFWAKVVTSVMNDGAPNLASVYGSDDSYAGVWLTRDYNNNRYEIKPNIPGVGSIYIPSLWMYQGDIKFFRLYKKGSEHGLIVNGKKYILSGTPTYTTALGSHTTKSVWLGNSSQGDVAIDELLLYKDFGNDSLIIPTAPY